jgi:adenylate kinase family enzyme
MEKVLVIGCPGSGKSTFCRKLANETGLPVIHLDATYHLDSWPRDERMKRELWREHVRKLVTGERWIIDGNYQGTFDIRMPAADTIIFFDFPRRITVYRVFKRFLAFRNRSRPAMPQCWKEKISWDFLCFVWAYRRVERGRVIALLDQYQAGHSIQTFKGPNEVSAFFDRLEP